MFTNILLIRVRFIYVCVCDCCKFILSYLMMYIVKHRKNNFSDKDIGIINFVRRSQNFIGGILT